ncbi:NAD(P)H-binding protein [Fragilaria crotonensis]|nr:NAD(P)H-binding protein [Fragilaria crotonensis]
MKTSHETTHISPAIVSGVILTVGLLWIALVAEVRKKKRRTASTPQVILLTGASSGIGKDAALSLIQQGHIVYGAARRVEKMNDLVEAGGHALNMDVQDESSIHAGIEAVMEKEGRLDVLINNAGFGLYGSVEDTSIDDARRQFDVCLFGMGALTKAVIPIMRNQGSGKIINISSMAGKVYLPLGAWYHGVKHAVEGWSDCLRLELAQFGIKVVIIEPGAIETDFYGSMAPALIEQSTGTAYETMAKGYVKLLSNGSHPSVVSDMISNAVLAKRPKTRYVGGANTQPIMFFRRFVGDYVTDKIALSLFK